MSMSRCYSLMKCMVIIFSIIFLCVGVLACGFAAWALWDGRASETPEGRAGLCSVAAWGGVLALGALFALCGAVRGSSSLLAAAFALLALSAVAETAAAWWGSAHLPQLQQALRDRLEHMLKNDYGLLDTRTQVLDAIQQGLECCGAESTRDWQNSAWSQQRADDAHDVHHGHGARTLDLSVSAPTAFYWVPASCCATSDKTECELSQRVPAASSTAPGLHVAPCAPRVLATLQRAVRVPLAAAAALLAAHALTLLLALALCLRPYPDHRYKA